MTDLLETETRSAPAQRYKLASNAQEETQDGQQANTVDFVQPDVQFREQGQGLEKENRQAAETDRSGEITITQLGTQKRTEGYKQFRLTERDEKTGKEQTSYKRLVPPPRVSLSSEPTKMALPTPKEEPATLQQPEQPIKEEKQQAIPQKEPDTTANEIVISVQPPAQPEQKKKFRLGVIVPPPKLAPMSVQPEPPAPVVVQEPKQALQMPKQPVASRTQYVLLGRKLAHLPQQADQQTSFDAQLANEELMMTIAGKIQFDTDILARVFELRKSLLQQELYKIREDTSLAFYNEQSVSQSFQYSRGKAGDRPEIATFKIKGDITNMATKYRQEVNEMLNKSAKNELGQLAAGLASFILTNGQKDADLLWDLLDLVSIEIFEKACIEEKFVEFYARLLHEYLETISKSVLFSNKQSSQQINYYITQSANVTLQQYVIQMLTNCRISPEFNSGRPVDERYLKCKDQELLKVHMRLSARLLAHLFMQSQGVLVTITSYVNFLRLILRNMLQSFANSIAMPFDLLKFKEADNAQALAEAKEILDKADPLVTRFDKYTLVLVDAVRIAANEFKVRCAQAGADSVIAKNYQLVKQVLEHMEVRGLLEGVQIYYLRQAFEGKTTKPEVYKPRQAAAPTQTLAFQAFSDQQMQAWLVETNSFGELCLQALGVASQDELIQAFANEKQRQAIVGKLKGFFSYILSKNAVDRFVHESSFVLRRAEANSVYVSMLQQMLSECAWLSGEQEKSRCYEQLAGCSARLLCQKQISLDSILAISDLPALFVGLVLQKAVQESYYATLEFYIENQVLEEDCRADVQQLIEKGDFGALNTLSELQQAARDDSYSYFAHIKSDAAFQQLLTKFERDAVDLLARLLFENSKKHESEHRGDRAAEKSLGPAGRQSAFYSAGARQAAVGQAQSTCGKLLGMLSADQAAQAAADSAQRDEKQASAAQLERSGSSQRKLEQAEQQGIGALRRFFASHDFEIGDQALVQAPTPLSGLKFELKPKYVELFASCAVEQFLASKAQDDRFQPASAQQEAAPCYVEQGAVEKLVAYIQQLDFPLPAHFFLDLLRTSKAVQAATPERVAQLLRALEPILNKAEFEAVYKASRRFDSGRQLAWAEAFLGA